MKKSAGDIIMSGVFCPTPTSSFIQGVQYVKRSKRLFITFKDGMYRYVGVHPLTARRMVEAYSVGKYFYRNIRDKFEFERVA